MTGGPAEELRARVFVSCGQSRGSEEGDVANCVAARLSTLGFDPYVAAEQQTLRGLKENIFAHLERSEYFVFIDFKRERLADLEPTSHRGSLRCTRPAREVNGQRVSAWSLGSGARARKWESICDRLRL